MKKKGDIKAFVKINKLYRERENGFTWRYFFYKDCINNDNDRLVIGLRHLKATKSVLQTL